MQKLDFLPVVFDFPTIAIHGKLKNLHIAMSSLLIILVILVTNIRSAYIGLQVLRWSKGKPTGSQVLEGRSSGSQRVNV